MYRPLKLNNQIKKFKNIIVIKSSANQLIILNDEKKL